LTIVWRDARRREEVFYQILFFFSIMVFFALNCSGEGLSERMERVIELWRTNHP
jgi:hypothetical protein